MYYPRPDTIGAGQSSQSAPFRMGTRSPSQPQAPHKAVGIFRRVLLPLLIIAVVAVGGFAGWFYWRSHICLPQLDGTIRVSGLGTPVEVRRDARGVPHLRAQSLEDLTFAQGYVTAQDRLWQMDLERRLAEGQLSEIFGERTLHSDIENRTLGFSLISDRAAAELDAGLRKVLAAYSRGVNAFISSHRRRLPIEFMALRYRPRPWREADSFAVALNMVNKLSTSWPSELMREQIRNKVSADLYSDLFPDHSPLDHPVAEDVGAAGLKTGDLRLGTRDLHFRASSLESSASLVQASILKPLVSAPGSNNWVLDGGHTESGKPLLANDPHLGHSVPSVWYMIHLKAPGLNASGVSLPGLPFIIIGHNERIGWGVTNTGADVQDLYAESFKLEDPRKYLHEGNWIDDTEREETIKVRNARDYRLTVKITRHGPVISHEGDRDLALQWTALAPRALRFPFLKINQAHNWQEFTEALRDYSGPTQNFVYADVDGNIGYYTAGWIPIRKRDDGTVPLPGSNDDYDWTGTIPFESLPHAYNPSIGMIATANGRIVPDSYPYLITRKWEAPYRTARIFQLLQSKAKFNVTDMLRFQNDIDALEDVWLKEQLLRAAAAHPPEGNDAQYALALLRDWDGQARADSGATLVAETTRRALLERFLTPKLGDDLSGYSWPMSTTFLENVIDQQLTRWLPPGDADFNVTLVKSLEEAARRIPDVVHSREHGAWKWGDTIPLIFNHPLSARFGLLRRFVNVGPYPQAGTGTTVKQTTSRVGPSMRMVVDFSNLDNSAQNITLGESGQCFSPFYRDQFDAWYSGRSFPMLFSDPAVEQGTVHKLLLEPAGQ